ncbi:MAG: glycosyltransferase [Elusimicrobiales bacterium]
MPDALTYPPIENPSVSVVVPVYNEAECIGDCLDSLAGQDFGRMEIIVVDDGSTDASAAVAASRGAKVIKGAHRGAGAARNAGAAAASGDFLLLVDADMTFAPHYVSRLIAPLRSGKEIASCHWGEMVANWENSWARCQTWFFGNPDRFRQPAKAPEREYVYRAVRRDFFLSSGGFSETEGRTDDSSVSKRTGVLSVVVPDAGCFHRNPAVPGEIFFDSVWRGKAVVFGVKGQALRALYCLLRNYNPLTLLLRGVLMAARKREPRLPAFSLLYCAGVWWGVAVSLVDGNYQK